MTVLKEGAGGIWHIYDKDTGKGRRIVVRTSHSVQSSKTLEAWKRYFAKAAHENKAIATAAKQKCMQEADASGAPERFYSDIKNKRCKMSVLRLYLRDALEEVAKHRPRNARRSSASATAGGTATAGGATSEVEGIEF